MGAVGNVRCAGCGKLHWPAQKWMHKNCVPVVANSRIDVVANKRSGDRHKKTVARKVYQRELMRQRRAAA